MTLRPRALFCLLAALSLAAGCLNTGTDEANANGPAKRVQGRAGFAGEAFAGGVDVNRSADPKMDFSKVIVAQHPEGPEGHSIRSLHPKVPVGMKVVGYNPLRTATEADLVDVWHSAMDAWDDGTNFYAAITHLAGTGGASIVDLNDPAKPKVVSQIYSGQANSDVQFTDDGKYVFLASIAGAPGGVLPDRTVFRQAPVPWLYDAASSGVSVWDVTDKTKPKFVLYREIGDFHNLFTVTINDTYILTQTGTKNVYKFDPKGGGSITKIGQTSTMVHDMSVYRHPITGDWLLYTGQGRGVAIIDFNDPANPVTIGEWAPEGGGDKPKGWHDQEAIPQLVDGRALLVVGGETQAGSEPYGVLDITDPTNPELVGQWELPGRPRAPAQSVTFFSPHEFYTWNGYFVSGNYHGGVWLVDVGSAERMRNPVTLGYFFAAEEPALHGAPQNPPAAWSPNHWGAYFDSRGYIITADWASGLYVLSFDKTGTWSPMSTG